jgi:DNA polymerase IIIc chi subunit
MYEAGERVLFLCDNDEEVQFFDSRLWNYSRLSFIAHGSKFSLPSEKAEYCQIWISSNIEFINNPQTLIHNGYDLENEKLKYFDKIIDVFDKTKIESARKRAELYGVAGFSEQALWIQEDVSWKAEKL